MTAPLISTTAAQRSVDAFLLSKQQKKKSLAATTSEPSTVLEGVTKKQKKSKKKSSRDSATAEDKAVVEAENVAEVQKVLGDSKKSSIDEEEEEEEEKETDSKDVEMKGAEDVVSSPTADTTTITTSSTKSTTAQEGVVVVKTLPIPPTPFNPVFLCSKKYEGSECWYVTFQGVEVQRRKGNDYVNASAILKAAKLPKKLRVSILKKLTPPPSKSHIVPFEKVEKGWHAFQGIYVPLKIAKGLAERWGLGEQLLPLFEAGKKGGKDEVEGEGEQEESPIIV